MERGETTRLLILMPPWHLKSRCVSVAFTAWLLGRDPSRRIIAVCDGADLAETFSAEVRRLLEAPWVRAVFPSLLLDKRKANAQELRTTLNGYRLSTSIGGVLTGKGCGYLLIDDPMKAEDARSQTRRDAVWEWFTSTAIAPTASGVNESPTEFGIRTCPIWRVWRGGGRLDGRTTALPRRRSSRRASRAAGA